MKWKLIVKEEAIEDITDAALWYEQKQTSLVTSFIEDVEISLKKIQSNPYIYQTQRKNIRHGFIRRFPYLIIYEVEEKEIVIYSIIQAQRGTKKRYSRIKK